MLYSKLPNLVLAFHGCDKRICDKVLYSHQQLDPSKNEYDWLGNGIYFWENSYERALQWAENHRKIKKPAVIGAVLDLGHCLNLMDYKSTRYLKLGYQILKHECEISNSEMPVNKNIKGNNDLLIRELDCAVIQRIHQYNKNEHKPSFDSIRGVFIEGDRVYENSGFREKTHIQICIVNHNCIKGYFKPYV